MNSKNHSRSEDLHLEADRAKAERRFQSWDQMALIHGSIDAPLKQRADRYANPRQLLCQELISESKCRIAIELVANDTLEA